MSTFSPPITPRKFKTSSFHEAITSSSNPPSTFTALPPPNPPPEPPTQPKNPHSLHQPTLQTLTLRKPIQIEAPPAPAPNPTTSPQITRPPSEHQPTEDEPRTEDENDTIAPLPRSKFAQDMLMPGTRCLPSDRSSSLAPSIFSLPRGSRRSGARRWFKRQFGGFEISQSSIDDGWG
ncbi:hypothetical protein P154DRAFT_581362 [Amniculicola lignicola CBS 123094]|uniref:Uncharacterized protein n=1 Tax=Amniculicola lignicola CBS 123094 TaxID=1392246 RepID=A0A6A5W162_9PLEO|nr:hypothetical protein P154DRAFT_581362 [Amniculicola lignicola CBS 123094]